jgi:hypothetical protein
MCQVGVAPLGVAPLVGVAPFQVTNNALEPRHNGHEPPFREIVLASKRLRCTLERMRWQAWGNSEHDGPAGLVGWSFYL